MKVVKYNSFKSLRQDSKMQDLDQRDCRTNGRWTKEEHLKFLEGIRIHGKNWKKIEQLIGTRTGSQIRSHAQKFFLKTKQTPQSEGDHPEAASLDMEQDGMTTVPKIKWDMPGVPGDFSFFLGKILEYSRVGRGGDFWKAFVDVKCATDNLSKPKRNGSFISYEDELNSNETPSSTVVNVPGLSKTEN